jgi:hypothetical protein
VVRSQSTLQRLLLEFSFRSRKKHFQAFRPLTFLNYDLKNTRKRLNLKTEIDTSDFKNR